MPFASLPGDPVQAGSAGSGRDGMWVQLREGLSGLIILQQTRPDLNDR